MFDFLNSGEEAPQQGIGGVLNPGMDPVSQAFLLNAGLRMLAGGWGSPATKVAGALSSGLEAAGGAAEIAEQTRRADEKTGLARQELNQRREMNQEDIASRERIAKMYTDQRRETAGRGGAASTTLERQRRQTGIRAYEAYKLDPLNSTQNPEELEAGARDAFLSALEMYDDTFAGGKTSPNPAEGPPPVGQPGAPTMPGKTSPNLGPQSAVTPRQPAPTYTPFAPRGQPTAAKPSPSTGGTPFSQVITGPQLTPEQRAKFMRLKDTAPGRQQLRSMGINPDG